MTRAPTSVYTFYYGLILASAITLVAVLLVELGLGFVLSAVCGVTPVVLDGRPQFPRLDDGVRLGKKACTIAVGILTFLFTLVWKYV